MMQFREQLGTERREARWKMLRAAIGVLAVLSASMTLLAMPSFAANVQMTASDANAATTSFNGAGHWSNGMSPSSANDYFTDGFLMRTPNSGTSNYFGGNSLSVDGNPANALAGLAMKYPGSGAVQVDDLRLNGGAIFNGQGGVMSVYGQIHVTANSFLDPQAGGRTLAIYAPIDGGSANTIGLRAASGSAGGLVQLLGDNSGYSGNWKIWGTGDSAPGAMLQVGNGGTSGNLGTGDVINNSAIMFNRSDDLTVGNGISGPGNMVTIGTGTLRFTGAKTYQGATYVSAGKLVLSPGASISNSLLVFVADGAQLDVSEMNGFALAAGQTLAGRGTVKGSVDIARGSALSPGDSGPGTLTVDGNVSLKGCATRWDLTDPNDVGGNNDLLVVSGDLALSPGITANLVFPNGEATPGKYVLCQFTGNLTGDPANISGNTGTNAAQFVADASSSPKTLSVVVGGTNTPPETNSWHIIKVYLQGGQSNADGRARTNGLPAELVQPQNDVPLYYYLTGGAMNGDGTLGTLTTLRPGESAIGGGTTFGPEITFGRALANFYAVTNQVPANSVTVAIIKYAHGGTSLASDWASNGSATSNGDGPDYKIFQQVVWAGLNRLREMYPGAAIELDGMTWVQGETDIDNGGGASSAYGANLVHFINDVRQTFGTNRPYGTNLPFFLTRISANQTVYSNPSDPDYPNYLLLRAGQAYAADALEGVHLTDTDGASFSTQTPYTGAGLHFDTAGQQAIGIAFGNAAIAALPRSELATPQKTEHGWSLAFHGNSGSALSIERANTTNGPWTELTRIVVGPTGLATFEDTNAPGIAAFYRVREAGRLSVGQAALKSSSREAGFRPGAFAPQVLPQWKEIQDAVNEWETAPAVVRDTSSSATQESPDGIKPLIRRRTRKSARTVTDIKREFHSESQN